jgi:nanoRNase/pAp phosphatase (c-di-AMP/oligoRNAs hydrolase)
LSDPVPIDAKERVEKLCAAFENRRRALVLTHDNPDPDGLASAFTLAAVLTQLTDVECEVGYAGIIGRAENRAMLRVLELAPARIHGDTLERFDSFALVDTQPGFGNNSLPEDRQATAVVDHHPGPGDLVDVAFVDIRDGYGACATIVHEYAQVGGVPLPENLLTALFYAIKSETQELGRGAGYADREAYLSLLPRADKLAIARIQRAPVPRNYFRAFQVAIENARLYDRTVVTDLQRVDTPDLVAEIADFLLRLDGADWAVCMGRYEDSVVMSLRTAEEEAHAGKIIRRVVTGLGRAGGHGSMAGGRVPLEGRDYDDVAAQIRERLVDELAGDAAEGESLVAN